MEALQVAARIRGASFIRNTHSHLPAFLLLNRAFQPLQCSGISPQLCNIPARFNHIPNARILRIRMQSTERSSQGSSITTVPVQVAHELLNAGHRYLDVRTSEEFAAGHIEGAVNVPYLYKMGSGMTKNPKFLEEVGAQFGKDDELVVGCQMGKRSEMATRELVVAGFTAVTDMAGGYSAWVQSGMATT